MRLFLLFSLLASSAIAIGLAAAQGPGNVAAAFKALLREQVGSAFAQKDTARPPDGSATGIERLLDIESYEDLDYGFTVAIPVGWRKIVTADSVAEPAASIEPLDDEDLGAMPQSLEPGYAVGFESVQQDEGDRFADYILIEVLPGDESGRFEAADSIRHPVTIDGRQTWFDRLEIDQVSSGLIDVDLVVYQAELSGVGYTVGLYAIGEPIREQLLAMAFEVMLQTFKVIRDPFTVS